MTTQLFKILLLAFTLGLMPRPSARAQQNLWQPTNWGILSWTVVGLDSDNSLYAAPFSGGLWRSDDGGAHWLTIPAGGHYGSPWFSGKGDFFVREGQHSRFTNLVRFTDRGKSWKIVMYGLLCCGVQVIYGNQEILLVAENEILVSDDNGDTWRKRDLSRWTFDFVSMIRISGDTLIAGTSDGIARSTDDGYTWTRSGLQGSLARNLLRYSERKLLCIRQDTLFLSTDAGLSWRQAQSPILPDTSYLIRVLRDGKFFAQANKYTSGKPYFSLFAWSDDEGTTWNRTGIQQMFIVSGPQLPAGGILAYTDGDSLLQSDDLGSTWRPMVSPWNSVRHIIPMVGNRIFANLGNRMYFSNDGGWSWQRGFGNSVFTIGCMIATADRSQVYIGQKITELDSTGGIYLMTSFPFNRLGLTGHDITALYAADPARLIAASSHKGIFFHERETTWKKVDSTGAVIAAFCYSRGNILAGGELEGRGIILTSPDSGKTWAMSSEYSSPITCMTVGRNETVLMGSRSGMMYRWFSPVSIDSIKVCDSSITGIATNWKNIIMASTGGQGVFRSMDGGTTWEVFNTGLPTTHINTVVSDSAGNFLAGTEGARVYKVSVDGETGIATDRSTIPQAFSLSQNYPNPFNPVTAISYSLPEEAFVTLTIYNILGQEVAKLVDEKKQAGRYSATWDAVNVPSGVYFYKIRAGTFSEVRKMAVVR